MHLIHHTQEHLHVASNFCYVYRDAQTAQTSSYIIPGQHYLETFMPLSYNNQDHTFMGDYIIPVLNQQTRLLLHLWRPYPAQIFNNALTVVTYIPLRHLATKIPSQPNNYFLPSYESCSIKVPFILAVIKTFTKTFLSLGSSLIYLPLNIARK